MTKGKTMKIDELMTLCKDFIEDEKASYIIRQASKHAIISFKDMIDFSPHLAQELIDNPENILEIFNHIVYDRFEKQIPIRIKEYDNLESNKIRIRDIRTENLNKFYCIEGIIRQISDVRPLIVLCSFECPSCGNVIRIKQTGRHLSYPSRCGCGRKGKFNEISKEMIDTQRMVIEENLENLEGNQQPKKLNVILRGSITSPEIKNFHDVVNTPGSRLMITGTLKEMPVYKDKSEATERELCFEANYIKPLQDDYINIEITEKDIESIKELSKKDGLMEQFVNSLAPTIYSHNEIKEAIILQLFGGITKYRGKEKDKGEIHILMVGDPGTGKSKLTKAALNYAPKGRYSSGARSSGAGLTATIVKDEFIGSWGIEGGAMVMTNNGLLVCDEFDKMRDEDRDKMLESLSEGTITIDKANIHTTLKADTSLLAAANPRFSRFDAYAELSSQIDLKPELINRFDIIFPLRDIINAERDEAVMETILQKHQGKIKSELDRILVKKYIIYAKKHIFPKITDEVSKLIKEFYVKIRTQKQSGSGEKSVGITARQGESMLKLIEASARFRLSNEVNKDDFERARRVLMYSLEQLALDPETGLLDIDRIETGTSSNTRNKYYTILRLMEELQKLNKPVPIGDIVEKAKESNIEEHECESLIEKLKTKGDIFEPRRGFWQLI